jgi:hypothetical protein
VICRAASRARLPKYLRRAKEQNENEKPIDKMKEKKISRAVAWVKKEAAYLFGMEEYVYGFPLVMIDVTRQVLTAVPKAGEYYAPINQLVKMRSYVDPDYKVVVRISRNSLLSGGVMDVGTEPMIVSIPDCKEVPMAVRWLNHWTDVFATAGNRTPEPYAGDYLVVGPAWSGSPLQISRRSCNLRRGTRGSCSKWRLMGYRIFQKFTPCKIS